MPETALALPSWAHSPVGETDPSQTGTVQGLGSGASPGGYRNTEGPSDRAWGIERQTGRKDIQETGFVHFISYFSWAHRPACEI